jgi:hypothetical protein
MCRGRLPGRGLIREAILSELKRREMTPDLEAVKRIVDVSGSIGCNGS